LYKNANTVAHARAPVLRCAWTGIGLKERALVPPGGAGARATLAWVRGGRRSSPGACR